MIVTFYCSHCQTELEVESTEVGDTAPCPACQEIIMVPAAGVGPGTQIRGFEVVRRLGGGGMGEVFLAKQLAMNRMVALKVLPPAMTRQPHLVERFMHEVQMTGRLEHQNIVVAFDAGEDAGYHYLAMSYIDGEDLGVVLERQGTMPEAQALRICRKVAEALAYAWDTHKLLHRDIKPGNIMIARDGEVKLMDMGIAKSLSDDSNLTIAGTLLGTPFYMSPEQAKNAADLDYRADIYSLGATLYYLVTGTRPFEGETVMAVLAKQLSEPLPPPEARNPKLSAGCAKLLRLMLAKDRAQRPASWQALIADIDAVLQQQAPPSALLQGGYDMVVDKDGKVKQLPPKSLALRPPSAGRTPGPGTAGGVRVAGSGATGTKTIPVAAVRGAAAAGVGTDSTPGYADVTRAASAADAAAASGEPGKPAARSALLESLPVNPELPSNVKRTLTIGSTLLVVLLLAGVIYALVRINSASNDARINQKLGDLDAKSKEQEVTGDVNAKINALQVREEVKTKEAERLKNLADTLEYAQGYAQAHPEDYEGALSKFAAVRKNGAGTKYELMADDEIKKLERAHSHAAPPGK